MMAILDGDEEKPRRRWRRHSSARYRAIAAYQSPKAWPTVEMMSEVFDDYSDILMSFRSQIEQTGRLIIDPLPMVRERAGDNWSSMVLQGYVDAQAKRPPHETKQQRLQREYEMERAARQAEQKRQSDEQWAQEEARRAALGGERWLGDQKKKYRSEAEVAEENRQRVEKFRAWADRENERHRKLPVVKFDTSRPIWRGLS